MSEAHSFVYFIGPTGGGPVKIGTSTNCHLRLLALQTASPAKLELLCKAAGGLESERALHGLLIEHWLHGEWFSPAPAVLAIVKHVRDTGSLPELPDAHRTNPIRRRDLRPWSPERRGRHAAAMKAYAARRQRTYELACEFGRRGSSWPYGDAGRALQLGISPQELRPDLYPSEEQAAA